MLEQLQCQMCTKHWSRQMSRGRKPRFCPDCVVLAVTQSNEVSVESDQDSIQDTSLEVIVTPKPPAYKKIWQCPSCKAKLTMHVKLVEPPTCNNPLIHHTKCVEMEPYARKKEALAS